MRLEASHDIALLALGPYAARDLRRGIKAGRFDVQDANIALVQTGGALLAVMRAVLDGRAERNAAQHHAAGVLRLLGLDPADAAEVAGRRQPVVGEP